VHNDWLTVHKSFMMSYFSKLIQGDIRLELHCRSLSDWTKVSPRCVTGIHNYRFSSWWLYCAGCHICYDGCYCLW